MRSLVVVSLALVLVACKSSEDERLRKQIDSFPTHLYVAARILVAEPERNPELAHAFDNGKPDTMALARAAWEMRGMGAAEVQLWRDSKLRPLVFAASDDPAVRALDHALILAGLTVFSIAPGAGPVAPESAVLYEAYMTGDGELGAPNLTAMARSVQAFTYARAGYCGLASAMTDKSAAIPLAVTGREVGEITATAVGLGHFMAHAPDAAFIAPMLLLIQSLPWSSRLLGYGMTAHCLDERGDHDAADREWQRAIDVGSAIGLNDVELDILRGMKEKHRGNTLELFRIVHAQLDKQGVYDKLRELPQVKAALAALTALKQPLFR